MCIVNMDFLCVNNVFCVWIVLKFIEIISAIANTI